MNPSPLPADGSRPLRGAHCRGGHPLHHRGLVRSARKPRRLRGGFPPRWFPRARSSPSTVRKKALISCGIPTGTVLRRLTPQREAGERGGPATGSRLTQGRSPGEGHRRAPAVSGGRSYAGAVCEGFRDRPRPWSPPSGKQRARGAGEAGPRAKLPRARPGSHSLASRAHAGLGRCRPSPAPPAAPPSGGPSEPGLRDPAAMLPSRRAPVI